MRYSSLAVICAATMCLLPACGHRMIDPDVRVIVVNLENRADRDAHITVQQQPGAPGSLELPPRSSVRLILHGSEPDYRPIVQVGDPPVPPVRAELQKVLRLPLAPGHRQLIDARRDSQRFILNFRPPEGWTYAETD